MNVDIAIDLDNLMKDAYHRLRPSTSASLPTACSAATPSSAEMDSCYMSSSSNGNAFTEIWKQPTLPPHPGAHLTGKSRQDTPADHHGDANRVDLSATATNAATGPVPTMEFEPLSNIFSFSAPTYKEFTLYKDKEGPLADALLSLKHVSQPPSPGHYQQQPHAGPYSYHHHAHQAYGPAASSSSSSSGQYAPPPPPPQYHAEATSAPPSHHQGMFPSMSVNVSMSMNVGMPPPPPPPPPTAYVDQWGTQHVAPTSPTSPSGGHGGFSPSSRSLAPQYHAHSYQPQAYAAPTYGFPSELRSPSASHCLGNETYYTYKGTASDNLSKLYTLNSMAALRSGRGLSPRDLDNQAIPGKVNLCRVCGKTYARPSTLKTHMRTHSGEKPYRCQSCNKSFSQAANLTAHIRTHSGEKPFRCPVCDRRFSQSSSVTTHMRTHSGERPYRCRMCKKAFSDSSTLTKHLRIHSGEKPYQCKLCLLRFSQSGNLNRHMRVHANQQQ